ncbi:MAG: cation-translocating P-type ATPase [Bacteroidota bacterium]|nr:cation-translocating P-type ATPase [Bacteroidota bacterium]
MSEEINTVKETVDNLADHDEHEHEHNNKVELIRLAVMAVGLILSFFDVLKSITSFDFIALAITIVGGFPMYKEAFENIRERKMTMELSMTIAVIATLFIQQYFTGAIITFFVQFAELLEHLTVSRGRRVIEKLIALLPNQATIRRGDKEVDIKVAELAPDEIIIIKPGTKIPVDGQVLKGNSFVDESSITGESLSVEKTETSKVFAGTINQNGVLEVRASRIGKDTMFGKIIDIIEQAEKSKAPIQRVADKLAGRLVYLAFGGAIITYLITHDIVSAIAALIVAGACGVAAGTPLAVLAGVGRTAKEGIIVKGGIYLEQLSKVDTIVFDKTGTLTFGNPEVMEIKNFNGISKNEVLELAACAEQHSEHPLAEAIMRKAKGQNLNYESYGTIEYLPGLGMICKQRNQNEILVGNQALMKRKSIPVDSEVTNYVNERKHKGETTILISSANKIAGAISIADKLRNEAKHAVQEIKQMGCCVLLLSGDANETAKAIGEILQVDEVIGEMLPHQKLEKIKELNAAGKKVAMVGDGINDAPALVEASVGIAMGAGTEIALESADMALTTNNLLKIPEALRISKQVMNVIMFNFWGTVIVDSIGIGLAMSGYLSPLVAALIHVTSELGFILNSARLFGNKKISSQTFILSS